MLAEVRVSLFSVLLAICLNFPLPLEYSSLISSLPWDVSNFPYSLPYPILLKPLELGVFFLLDQSHRLVAFTGYCLGFVFLVGLQNSLTPFGLYLTVLAFFHFSEYIATGLSNPQNLSFDSFLVNHSIQYGLAMLISWLEYFLQLWFYPDVKLGFPMVSYAGLVICLLGELTRKMAMLQAGRNFNHLVQSSKADEHQLVTDGVYSLCRHPSYLGWFLWSLGSQILLVNPLCLIIYGVVSYAFFKERIYVEEYTLIAFFGDQYREYQKKVGSGIPGIEGFHGPVMWGEKQE
eukprot:GFUD01010765.1.p1 GENE.GFUD01010765.1~~GFUD01010765.1.p1  ORF type:complete len:290 (-),score=52.25 GFUD01010765.1:1278-2147(-)